jgi:octanoyl-[GcvH]:protein N-octanoyltransferase
VRLVQGPSGGGPVFDLAVSQAVLRRVGRGELPTTLRVYRPTDPTVVFGRLDTHRSGVTAAVRASFDAGFTPAVRGTGGRAVAYTRAALVLDQVSADPAGPDQIQARFRGYGELIATVLRGVGVDARVGEVPGEYCPGAQSINAGGRVKLVGTAQRLIRGAWMFSAVLILDDADVVRPVLTDVYRALDIVFDPASVGAVRSEAPAVDFDDLQRTLLRAYAGGSALEPDTLDPDTLDLAKRLIPDHEV